MNIEELKQLLTKDIYDLPLSIKAANGLRRNGITNLKDLIQLTSEEVSTLPCVSNKAINEIINFVHNNGLFFRDELEVLQLYSSIIHENLNPSDNPLDDKEQVQINIAKLCAELIKQQEETILSGNKGRTKK